MFKAAIRSLLARKVRLLLTTLSIVLGVGFMAGTYVLTDTMTKAFDDLITTGTSAIDVLVRSENAFEQQNQPGSEERQAMPESVLDLVRDVPGVAEAAGDVLGYAQIVDPETGKVIGTFGPPTFGASYSALSGFTIKEGNAPHGPGEVAIDAVTSERHDIAIGDHVQILFEGSPGEFRVVGRAGFGESDNLAGATFALFDLPTAQRYLGRIEQLDTVYATAEEGVSATQLSRRIADVLPDGTEAVTAAAVASEQQEQVQQAMGFIQTALLVFALVALFVGAFIIFNTFAIIVAQRTRELGLLRAVGASRRQVLSSVVLEALVVGVVASAIGVVAGVLIAFGLQAILGATGFDLPSTGIVLQVRTIVVSMIVGTVVTVLAAVVPARRAARISPIQALYEVHDTAGRSLHFRLVTGFVVLALGVVPLLVGLFAQPSNGLQLVGAGVALTFIGIAMLTPLIARPVAGLLGRPVRGTGVSGKLGRENAMRNPRRTAATASALMIGLGLVVFVAVFGASAKASVNSALERTLKADFILTSPSFSGFSTSAAADVARVDGVAAVSPVRQGSFRVEGDPAFVSGVDPDAFPEVADAGVVEGGFQALWLPDSIMVAEDVAAEHGWSVGDRVDVGFAATGERASEIVGTYGETGIVGDYTISLAAFEENFSQQLDIMVLVTADPGVSLGDVERRLDDAMEPYPNVEVQDQAAFRDKQAGFVNQVLNLLTALLMMAVIIAVFGIVNTLSLSIYERTRELGLLRAVGMTRRQTRSMVRWEAVIISVMGALFGVAIGIAFGWALQQALEPEGFTELGIPGGQLVAYVIAAGLAGVVAAIAPARRAARLNVLEAISYE